MARRRPARDLYETLGVKKDASPQELKRARREKARAHHPDKPGGSAEAMAEINHAFDVLNDPGRRQLYDVSGQVEEVSNEEQLVESWVLSSFADAINSEAPNILMHAKKFISKRLEEQREKRQVAIEAKEELADRRRKIRTKEKRNHFHMIVDQQVQQIDAALAVIEKDLSMFEKAARILDAYETDEIDPPVQTAAQWQPGFGPAPNMRTGYVRMEDLFGSWKEHGK